MKKEIVRSMRDYVNAETVFLFSSVFWFGGCHLSVGFLSFVLIGKQCVDFAEI